MSAFLGVQIFLGRGKVFVPMGLLLFVAYTFVGQSSVIYYLRALIHCNSPSS